MAFKPIARGLAGGISACSPACSAAAARSGRRRDGAIKPFAAGGVIGTPTYFPLAPGGVGLAGEAGPEAIMPLARGPDGRLGVAMAGGRGAASITIHIRRPTPTASAARRVYLTGQIARAVRAAARERERRGRCDVQRIASAAFHEVLFPLDIALKSAGGPERRTEIVTLGSGREERNARWAHSRRRYDAGYGVQDARGAVGGGRLFRGAARPAVRLSLARPARSFLGGAGRAPRRSTRRSAPATARRTAFQLVKTYGGVYAPYQRPIAKPVAGSVRVAVDGVEQTAGHRLHLRSDDRRRHVSRRAHSAPPARR